MGKSCQSQHVEYKNFSCDRDLFSDIRFCLFVHLTINESLNAVKILGYQMWFGIPQMTVAYTCEKANL